jgi:hypothetical protein
MRAPSSKPFESAFPARWLIQRQIKAILNSPDRKHRSAPPWFLR